MQRDEDQSGDSSHLSQGSTPEEGEDAPTVEVFDLTSGSSGSLSPDTDVETLRTKLKEVIYTFHFDLTIGICFKILFGRYPLFLHIFVLL